MIDNNRVDQLARDLKDVLDPGEGGMIITVSAGIQKGEGGEGRAWLVKMTPEGVASAVMTLMRNCQVADIVRNRMLQEIVGSSDTETPSISTN